MERRRQRRTGLIMICAWILLSAAWVGLHLSGRCGRLGLVAGLLCGLFGIWNGVQQLRGPRDGGTQDNE